ncbi:MAG: radical SAM protein, partial [Chloroflexi bacterium]|nr:radical SAM protein [Chloroflexota bacterium]
VASTYNEPLITSEWAVEVFQQARAAGMLTMYVSNGNGTREVIDFLTPHLDAYKIDLKTMQDRHYRRELGGVLQNVLDTIRWVHEAGIWLEVLTLIVPGFNDSTDELYDAARYIASISVDIPWHVTAFHPDYKMMDTPPTTAATLVRAAEIGAEAGLRYVYAGNLPGRCEDWEDTRCPTCNTTLIGRSGYMITSNSLARAGGRCPQCGTAIPGIWQ